MAGQDEASLDTLLQMIAAFGQATAQTPVGEEPAGRTVQVVVNIFQSGAIAGPFAQGQGVKMGDHYNVSGSAGAVGKNASASNFSIQGNVGNPANIDLEALALELAALRAEMKKSAESVDDDAAVVAVGKAQLAAEAGDKEAVFSHLKSAGKWSAGVATSLGVGVAAGAIKAALGL